MKRFVMILCLTVLLLCGCGGKEPPEPKGAATISLPCNGFRLINGAGEDLYMDDLGGCGGSMTVNDYTLLTGNPADISLETPNIPPYTAEFDDPSDRFNALYVFTPYSCSSVNGTGIGEIVIDTDAVTVTGEKMALRIFTVVDSDSNDMLHFDGDAAEDFEITREGLLFHISGATGECTLRLESHGQGAASGRIDFTATGTGFSVDVGALAATGQTFLDFDDGTQILWCADNST